ncbi:MFS monocarboxylate transporter [Pseudohyphozyma bogoriensis]|nr:MFS monocarboxylate transporter [Pseudohyphozyma bogoriensis]
MVNYGVCPFIYPGSQHFTDGPYQQLAILNSVALIFRLSTGMLSDRVGKLNTAVPVALFTAIMIFIMPACSTVVGSVMFALFFGIASGAWWTLVAPCLMALAKDVSEIGSRVGFGFFFIALATLVGTPIAGALLKAGGSYWAPCAFGGAVTTVGAVLLALARWILVKRHGKWKV